MTKYLKGNSADARASDDSECPRRCSLGEEVLQQMCFALVASPAAGGLEVGGIQRTSASSCAPMKSKPIKRPLGAVSRMSPAERAERARLRALAYGFRRVPEQRAREADGTT